MESEKWKVEWDTGSNLKSLLISRSSQSDNQAFWKAIRSFQLAQSFSEVNKIDENTISFVILTEEAKQNIYTFKRK